MYVPFDEIEDSARIWVYQSSRKLTQGEKNTISETLSTFTNEWAAHGNALKTSFKIFYDQFIVLAADESFNETSGCSIDSSVRVIRDIDTQFKLSLFDRTNVTFLKNEEVVLTTLNELSKGFGNGEWGHATLVFNNTVVSKGELKSRWTVPAKESWLKRYLPEVDI